jgi:hypothetical protein
MGLSWLKIICWKCINPTSELSSSISAMNKVALTRSSDIGRPRMAMTSLREGSDAADL